MVQPQPLRARVDNLMLFTPEFFLGFGNNTLAAIDFHPDNVGAGLDASSALMGEDGWGWWPFDISAGQTGDFHWVSDQSGETMYQNMGNFYMVGIPEYNEYDSAGAEAYYYDGQSPALSGQ